METPVSDGALRAHARFRQGEQFELDVALEVNAGETLALVGPNGAGKTTLLRLIAGLSPVDEGSISLGSRTLDDPSQGVFVAPAYRGVGLVFQDHVLFPRMTVLDNVGFGLRSNGSTREQARTQASSWLETVGLSGMGEKLPGDLSGGESQRVALARALITQPSVLLLDEPLAALDVTTRVGMRRLLDEHLSMFDGPRVLITHEPGEAFLLADRIAIIENGVITQTGTARDIQLRPRTDYAADLAGSNLLAGQASNGAISVDGHLLHPADDLADGPILATIEPSAVALHAERPHGSPRNVWATSIELVETLGTRTRVLLGAPLPLTVELTTAARDELHLEPGTEVWAAVKATEIDVQPG